MVMQRERERENVNVWLPLASPTGDLAHKPGMCPDQEPGSKLALVHRPALTQSTEPHQPRLILVCLLLFICQFFI